MSKKEIKGIVMLSSAIAASAGLYLAKGSIKNFLVRKAARGDATQTTDTIQNLVKVTKEPIKRFGGLTIDEIRKLGKNIHRVHDIKIDKKELVLLYKSRSGKTVNRTRFKLNKDGKLVGIGPYPTASVPRVFAEKLVDMLKHGRKGGIT